MTKANAKWQILVKTEIVATFLFSFTMCLSEMGLLLKLRKPKLGP